MSSSHLFFLLATVATFSIAHGQQNCTNRFGNANRGQCQVVDECQGAALAPTVGQCSQANQICCINDPRPTPTIPGGVKLTRAMFLRLVGNTTRNNYMYNYVVSSMNLAGLFAGSNSDYKVAAYLAQLVGETDYFRNLESKIWDDPDNNPYLGNKLPGDGVKFMGRGAILVRGRDNYENANSSKSLNLGFDLIAEPEQAAYPSIAFRLATWFWRENAYVILGNERAFKGDLSRLVDGTFLNFTHLTHALTNNLQALKDRAELNDLALAELKVTSMKRGQGVECSIGDELGYAVPICLIDFQKQYCGCEGEVNNRGCPYGETEDGRCRSSAIIKCCVERCSSSLDLTIAMDSSGSIGAANFAVQTKFVKSLLGGLNLAPNFTQIGLIDFNTQPTLLIDFVTFVDLNSTLKVIDSIKYLPNRLTYTDRALRMANEEVMQERRGMRPMESATPKVVMVITDGLSTDPKRTLDEADRIKERGIDIISVGIGKDSNIDELVGIASTPDDQYFVEDFDKLYLIISGLQKTTCQKPAEIPPQVAVKGTVEKKSYKYYRVNIADADFGLESNRFTVQMDTLVGQADLFYSFTNENPKSDEDFVDPNKDKPSWEGNFVEKTSSSASVARRQRSIRSAQEDERASGKTVMRAVSQSFYQIERPQEAPNDVLYFSVRGLESSNEFEVYVHNRTVNAANKSIYLSSGSIGFVLIINFIISLGVF